MTRSLVDATWKHGKFNNYLEKIYQPDDMRHTMQSQVSLNQSIVLVVILDFTGGMIMLTDK